MVAVVFIKNFQNEIVVAEHNRADRAGQEYVKQIQADYFFLKGDKKIRICWIRNTTDT